MPIIFDSEKRMFKLDTATSSYIIEIFKENYLVHLYYGAKIPDMNVSMLKYNGSFASFSPQNINIDDCRFSPDVNPMEYPGEGAGDFRSSAVAVRNADGNAVTDMRYKSHKIYGGKPALEGMPSLHVDNDDDAATLEILTEDSVTGVQAVLYYTVFEKLGAMARHVRIINASDKPVEVERVMSCCVDFTNHNYDMLTLYGKWGKERSLARRPLEHGRQLVSSKRGSSGHHQNPFGAIVGRTADEDKGEAYGFNFIYSSNFLFEAEVDGFSGTRVIMGINPDGFGWHLDPGEHFEAPEAVTVYTNEGIGEMSRIFHRLYTKHLFNGKWKDIKRPLLINNWEATGMEFDGDTIVSFAKKAKELGIEMLVMDDGWFGHRDDDTSSLGDWQVNEEKLGGSLAYLIERINALGMKFGIWYEPEMISRDSDLYRAHPDWCIHVPGREKSIARHQYVLDFSRKDVRDYIFNEMYKVLSVNKVDYLKWDFNRNLSEIGSAALPPERQKEVAHRFVLGTYEVMDRLTKAFPDMLLENCSGGGGRFDPGMLYYSPQIWTSDNTDPLERLSIQFGTSMCYPASTMGAHVSASKRAGYDTKANVALWGTFGYELDPNRFTKEESELIKAQVAEYHKYYDVIHYGELYRLISPFENEFRAAWMFVSQDKDEALVTSVVIKRPEDRGFTLRLKGLDPAKYYVDEDDGEIYSGALLMNAGICLDFNGEWDGDSFKKHFKAVK